MVKSNIGHENTTEYYRKLANMMVNNNIQLFYARDAKIMKFEFKKDTMS